MIGRITSACGGIDWVHNKVGNKRIYGAWGDLRYDGNPGDGPNTQYCANLGHKLDNESGLTYMRARYYEPWTGRFINEDPARDGWNWYGYCGNNAINKIDFSGCYEEWINIPDTDYYIRIDVGEGDPLHYHWKLGKNSRENNAIYANGTIKHGSQAPKKVVDFMKKYGKWLAKVRRYGGALSVIALGGFNGVRGADSVSNYAALFPEDALDTILIIVFGPNYDKDG